MGFVSTGHLWILAIVLVIVLIIWGPGKLPDVGAGLGRAIREFRKASTETREEFHKATRWDGQAQPQPAPQPTEPLAQRDPTAPETPTQPAPAAPIYPAALGGGNVLGAPPENDPR